MSSLQATAAMDSALTVIIGPSQHGKSTLIEILLDGSDSVAIGNGSGISCTTELKLYQNTKIGRLLDTVGFDDSDQLLSNQAIAEQLASFLVNHDAKTVTFILVNSLADSVLSITKTFQQFNLVFPHAHKSVLVLGTKVDKVSTQDELKLKWSTLETRCKTMGFGTQMQWKSYKDPTGAALDASDLDKQVTELNMRLKKLSTYTPQKAHDLQERIKQKMEELHRNHVPPQQEIEEEVDEPFLEDYETEVEEPIQTANTTLEKIKKKVPVTITVLEQVDEPCVKYTLPVLGIPFEGTRKKTFPLTKVKYEEVEEVVPITNSSTEFVKRMVKKKRESTRKVTKTMTVDMEVPVELFREKAKEVVLEENDNSIKKLLENAEDLRRLDHDLYDAAS